MSKRIQKLFTDYGKEEDAHTGELKEWEPLLTPSQRRFYYDPRKYILAHSERGTGKSLTALHKDIKHCYENDGALCLIVTINQSAGKIGGIWLDLTTQERFAAGPLEGQPAGVLEMWREGFGLEYGNFTTGKKDSKWIWYQDNTKTHWVDIRNMHGGISRIAFKSMPAPSLVLKRIKDLKPSFFHFEELSQTDDPIFFTAVIQQLGRLRSVVPEAQQYIATCNPSHIGQTHWVFRTFMVDPHVLHPGAQEKLETHSFDFKTDVAEYHEDYGVHHVKMEENIYMPGKDEYLKRLIETARKDPTEYQRAVLGLWVPKVTGDNLFANEFDKEIHVRGTYKAGLEPVPQDPIIIGYDPGHVNNARIFQQLHYFKDRPSIWRVFDEQIYKKQKVKIETLVRDMLEKMYFWCARYDWPFTFVHVSDNQALTQWNNQGSYEYMQYEKISREMIRDNERYAKYLKPIRMRAPEKHPDSVAHRVSIDRDLFLSERIFISAFCTQTIEMCEGLKKALDRHKNPLDDKPLKSSDGYIHTYDAFSYPHQYFAPRESIKPRSNNDLAMIQFGVK